MEDYQVYISADLLLWWIRPSNYPQLVTSGTPPTTAIGDQGAPRSLFPGFRLNFGYWFEPEHCLAIEGNILYLGRQSTQASIASSATGVQTIGPAFVNPITGVTQMVASPGVSAGGATATFTSELWGAEANFRSNLCTCDRFRLDGIAGFRFLGLNEGFTLAENSTQFPGPIVNFPLANFPRIANGETVSWIDSFNTANRFYGSQVGLLAECRFLRRWYLDGNFKIGLGETRQSVIISGQSTDSLTALVVNNGSLAQRSNIGQYSRNVFSVVPEIGLTLGMNVTDHLRVYAGYTFLCWTGVARPGEQVNPNRVNPTFAFQSSTFFADGVNIGLEYRF
jgi:hypothetical protein